MEFFLERVVNALPFSFLLVAVTWLFLRWAHRVNAATRHTVWWVVLAIVALLPFKPEQLAAEAFAIPASGPAMVVELGEGSDVLHWVAVAMLGVTAMLLLRLVLHCVALHWMKWRAPKLDAVRLNHWRKRAGLLRRVSLRESRHMPSPIACGYLLPAIILPEGFAARTTADDMDHVLLHELGHLARRDDFTQLAARIVEALAWWHPLVLFLLRRIELEREVACDDRAIARAAGTTEYAATLTRLVESRLADEASALAPGIGGRRSQFARRIQRLLSPQRNARPGFAFGSLGATLLMLAAVALAALQLPPVLAFADETSKPGERAGFLAALAQAGYRDLSVEDIITLKSQGVMGTYIAAMNEAAGKVRLKPEQLLTLKQHGISPANLRAARQYGDKITIDQIIRLKQAGVL